MNPESEMAAVRVVRRLYKYSPFSTNLLSALVSGQLWYSKATSFNDPFDCAVINYQRQFELGRERAIKKILRRPSAPPQATESEKRITEALQRIHNQFITHRSEHDNCISGLLAETSATLQESLYDFGVLCLTADPRSILMWSHYAANHTGVCLEFERTKGSKLEVDVKPVRYVSRRYPSKNSNLVFDKFDGWKYEQEWRLLENHGDRLYPFPGPLRSIICGAKMQKESIAVIRNLVESPTFGRQRVAVKIASMHHAKYSILIRKSEA